MSTLRINKLQNTSATNVAVTLDTSNNVLVGSATSTGTASQPLQVTGGAYVSGSVGIASTNPTEVLSVVGNLNVSGIVTGGIVATTTQMAGVTTTGITTSGVAAITLAGTNITINNGDFVTGSGIAPGTTVTSGAGTVNLALSGTVGLTTASNQITTYPAGKIVTSGVIGGQLCRAWVNFDGINAGKIRAAYNVSSITKNAAGDYTMNLTTALPDANYSMVGSVQPANGTNNAAIFYPFTSGNGSVYTNVAPTTTAARFTTSNGSGGAITDYLNILTAIFR